MNNQGDTIEGLRRYMLSQGVHEVYTEDFIAESNRIEGIILRGPTEEEIEEHNRFVSLNKITLNDLIQFVSIYQPNAKLRDQWGMNVRVGSHYPTAGHPEMRDKVEDILYRVNEYLDGPFETHCKYETLHPFSDGNGRSGRAIWAWQMIRWNGGYPLMFLHHFYYQALQNSNERSSD